MKSVGDSPADKLRLQAAMLIIEAEEELKGGVEDDNALYDLVLRATGSEDRAAAALSARLAARLKANQATNV